MTGGPSTVFTRKAVVDETIIINSSNNCKSIVGIDASQLYPFSMCQDMPTGLYTRWEFVADMQNFEARHKRTLRIWSCLYTRKQERNVKLRAFLHLENKKKSTVLMWTVIVITVRQYSKQWLLLPLLFWSKSSFLHNRSGYWLLFLSGIVAGVVAETVKLLGLSSYGYQILDRSWLTIMNYLNDEKTHKAMNAPFFKRLNTVEKDLYEVELLKSTIENQKIHHRWIFYTAVCKTENFGTLL